MNLAWIDLETTGLRPPQDAILEIGIVITNNLLNEIAHASFVCKPSRRVMLDEVSPYVLEMHVKNGLWKESAGATINLKDVSALAIAFIKENEAEGSPACGSTVQFDRAFLKAQALELDQVFHYRNIDVSTLKNIASLYDAEAIETCPKRDKQHRAVDDLRYSIQELEHYLRRWKLGVVN